jgi:hypothetical protein
MMETVAAPNVEPMLATAGIPASIDGWVGEPKLDGWRARILVDGDELACPHPLRAGHIGSVPAIAGLAGLRAAVDGELVASAGRLEDIYRLGPGLARRSSIRRTPTMTPEEPRR